MNSLLRRSLQFYWRVNLGVVLGTALAALVLTGALFVGDCVKATLRQQAEARVGRVDEAFVAGERFVQWTGSPSTRRDPVGGLFAAGPDAAGVLLLQGTAARPDQTARANRVQVVGVDQTFWKLSPSGRALELAPTDAALNEPLARQLNLKVGDELLIRMEKPAAFSKDAPLSGEESDLVTSRLKVARIVGDEDFGRFSLNSGQIPPPSVFVSLPELQTRLALAGKVNVVLDSGRTIADRKQEAAKPDAALLLRDADTRVEDLPQNLGLEVRSSRVFLDEAVVAAARRNERETPMNGTDALTYFVNELRAGDGSDPKAKATPYSMVTAIDAPASGFVPAELADDEITITRWLADDLGADVGSKITIKYFVMGERRQLVEKARSFTVLGPLLEMNEPQLNTSWMPDFPNVPERGNFSSWKPGFPFESKRIRKKDEEYWDEYRGTPKAFVNLRAGQEMWGNRWGKLTSIRYPSGTAREAVQRAGLFIQPAAMGFRVLRLRDVALAATNAPVDFGQLFAGFSFFLIIAAAVLTALLFTFSIEQRAAEAGLLLAVGWPAKRVRRLFLGEGFALAVVGALLGSLLAVLYTQAVLRGLSTIWRGATGGTQFVFAIRPATFLIGTTSGVVVALCAMWLATRRLFKQEAALLLTGSVAAGALEPQSAKTRAPRPWWNWLRWGIELLALAATICLLILQPKNPMLFFGAGALLLAAGLSLSFRQLGNVAESHGDLPSASALALRNTSRRRGRSLATIAVLASGVFMVMAVDSFRKGPLDDATRRESGTGGFTLIGESSSPLYEDLNSAKGREQYSLDEGILKDVHIVQMRARAGDDASCLNLNRAVEPRLVGVNLAALNGRFRAGGSAHWQSLAPSDPRLVSGLVDANTLQWAMQKKIGDFVEYQDDRGNTLLVRVAGSFPASILQGMVLIDEADFIARFPNHAGYSLFLIECPPAKVKEVQEHLSQQLGDRGLEIIPTAARLAEFNAVENTYLSIFQILGGLGLLLGSAGLGIVVARNVLERRREFGLLEAVGFTPGQLRSLVFAEHRWLIVFSLGIGALSALIAVWPNLSQRGGGFPWMHAAVLLVGMAVLGVFWTWLATRISLRGSLLSALRDE
jgi:putative ABC transport system permease protein